MPRPSKTPAAAVKNRRQPIRRQRLGGVTVSVTRDGPGFVLAVHHADGKRTRQRFLSLNEATSAFSLRVAAVARDGAASATVASAADMHAITAFLGETADWTPRPSVADALAHFIEHRRALQTSGTVAQAVADRLADADRRGLSAAHLSNLRLRLGHFSRDFGDRPLATITPEELTQWLAKRGGARTQKNFLNTVGSIFTKHLESGALARTPAAAVRLPKITSSEPGVINATQLAALLAALPERSRACVVVQALAGVRASEAQRLTWQNISMEHRLITISSGVAKTASRRHVPVSDALLEWLQPRHRGTGPLVTNANTLRRDLAIARRKALITNWPHNALRHTCASAWCTIESDVARVAAWLGNSPVIIHQHYRALLTREQAAAWLAVRPVTHSEGKVVPFEAAC
jgi:integrase